MRTPVIASLVCAVAMLAGCATSTPAPKPTPASSASLKPLDEARLAEAQMLRNEHRYLEAAAIYDRQLKLQPANADLMAREATLLSMQADAEADPAKARSLNKQARALAEQAEKLGTPDPMPPILLASIKPDGSRVEVAKGAFSKREQVDQLMHDGEAAFARSDYDKAGGCYRKAFELEPTNYMAALYSGDSCFSSRQLEPACEWFRKAIAISPDTETAHRYLGDALAKLGQRDEALNEWIAALLCEPYRRTTRQHFTAEMRAAAEARGRIISRFPIGRFQVDIEKKEIGIDSKADNTEAIYALACATWRMGRFSGQFPGEKIARRSLPEEMAGLELLIETQQAVTGKDPKERDATLQAENKKWQPVIDGLVALKRDGLLEAYAFFERADEGLAKDYAAYRVEHRDKLERYLRVYWCGFE
jgi:tetratricopeptide (TPR) repeat protein